MIIVIGVSPSGKATDSDSVIRWFESSYPSHLCTILTYKTPKPCIFLYFSPSIFCDWGVIGEWIGE